MFPHALGSCLMGMDRAGFTFASLMGLGPELALETEVNQWPGVVSVGIFARHRASLCLLGTGQGVRTLVF